MRMKLVGIYAIENRINKKIYVGKSTDILRRWESHIQMLEKGHHHSFELQSDYDDLGIKQFCFYILELCEEEQLEEREVYWISKCNAEVDGYNMTDKSYKPPALMDAEIKQLKAENEELKKGLPTLIEEVKQLRNEVKQLRKENEQIRRENRQIKWENEQVKEEKAKQEKEVEAQKGVLRVKDDELYEQAYALVVKTQTASVSLLQRQLRIGYTRAARLIDLLEEKGVIGPYQGSAPREVLIKGPEMAKAGV